MIIDPQAKIDRLRSENPFIGSRELAYDIILNAILSGELGSDIKLTQSIIAAELEMSRTPVKEALSELERDGFIEKAGSASLYSVKQFDIGDFIDFSEMRLAIEPEAAFHAARYITDEGTVKLRHCLDIQEKLAASGNMAGLIFNHTQFHKLIVEASQNKYFIEIYNIYENKSLFFNRGFMSESTIAYNLQKHRQIAEMIINHDETAAREAMRVHLSFYAKSGARKIL